MSEWQPIETAPEGRPVLVYVQSGSQFVALKDKFGAFPIWGADQYDDHNLMIRRGYCNPSHWQPLPAPPGST